MLDVILVFQCIFKFALETLYYAWVTFYKFFYFVFEGIFNEE